MTSDKKLTQMYLTKECTKESPVWGLSNHFFFVSHLLLEYKLHCCRYFYLHLSRAIIYTVGGVVRAVAMVTLAWIHWQAHVAITVVTGTTITDVHSRPSLNTDSVVMAVYRGQRCAGVLG